MCGWRRDDMISISRRMCTMSCSSLIFSFRIDLMATWRPEHNRMNWDKKEKNWKHAHFIFFLKDWFHVCGSPLTKKSAWKVFFLLLLLYVFKKNRNIRGNDNSFISYLWLCADMAQRWVKEGGVIVGASPLCNLLGLSSQMEQNKKRSGCRKCPDTLCSNVGCLCSLFVSFLQGPWPNLYTRIIFSPALGGKARRCSSVEV